MKPLTWGMKDEFGQPYRWDQKNVTWSGILEPGDPGYQAPESTPGQTNKTQAKMKRQRYYPTRQAEQTLWLENFRVKVAEYATALALNATWVANLVKDALWLHYLLALYLPAVRAHGKAVTLALEQAEGGTGGPLVLPAFNAPALPEGVEVRDEGALRRLFDAVQDIKENDLYTQAIGMDMGIIGSEQGAPDFGTLAPLLKLTVQGNVVEIDWSWQGYIKFLDQIEIQVDRGNGWQVLTFDTTPGYTDTHPHPSTLTQWKYRAIFRVDDVQVGQWSPEVKVNVGG